MLNLEPFSPFCQQLVEERRECKDAVYSYNNTSNPDVKVTADEVYRVFSAILAASWTQTSIKAEPVVSGHLGHNIYINTPFMRDYGYNISIGDNVDIGTDCKFLDSGKIIIGRNTTIRANVTIDTHKTSHEAKTINGSRRVAVAAKVHIEVNVYIGADCTILPGVTIGSGATVHAGTVVVRVSIRNL